jgi:hypothetical protein
MSAQGFVNLFSVVVGFIAALFFCVGSALLTRKSIGALAGTYWDSNPHLANFLRVLKAEYFCGGAALCFAFLLQFIANVPGLLPDIQLFGGVAPAVISALIAGIFVGGVLLLVRRKLLAQLASASSTQK